MTLPDAPPQRTKMRLFKRTLFPLLSLLDVFAIILGKSQPRVPFLVKGDPPTTYYNFRIKPEKLEEFRSYINLPEGLPLAPITCIEGESPEYVLTLNVYQVGGIVSGARAEWSTYCTDHLGVTRYMVLESHSSKMAFDANGSIITKPTPVEHERAGSTLTSLVESDDHNMFSTESDLSSLEQQPYLKIAGEWIEANDFIYWRNGICDRVYYDAGMSNSRVKNVPDESVKIEDHTHWADFVEPRPMHTLVFEAPMEFVLMPWRNLEKMET